MTDLLLLAERVEGASGPDGELGREVLLACGWRKTPTGYFLGQLHMWSAPGFRSFDDDQFARHDPTASLDAALTLVPEGWTTALYQQDKGWAATLKKGFCTSYTDVVFNERGPNGHPATPALALTAACLRARHTMEGLS